MNSENIDRCPDRIEYLCILYFYIMGVIFVTKLTRMIVIVYLYSSIIHVRVEEIHIFIDVKRLRKILFALDHVEKSKKQKKQKKKRKIPNTQRVKVIISS